MHGAAAAFDVSWLERVSEIVHLLLALALLAFLVAVLPAIWSLRKSHLKVSGLVDRLSTDITPITARAARIADDVGHVTTTIRSDAARVAALVHRTEARIEATLARAEARARDLEALIAVAQTQAEDSLVAAASTMAGVREGFAALRDELAGVSHDRVVLGETDDFFDVASNDALDDVEDDTTITARDVRRPRIRARDG